VINLQSVEQNVLRLLAELCSTHIDVAPPDPPSRPTERGVEACDAKGQIAAQLGAMELLLASGISFARGER
jgi:acetylornithine deacetylase/succinyl-diaminopimelate desuccinylase-like protein